MNTTLASQEIQTEEQPFVIELTDEDVAQVSGAEPKYLSISDGTSCPVEPGNDMVY